MTRILISLIIPFLLLSGCSLKQDSDFDVSEIRSKQDGYYVYKTDRAACYPVSIPDTGTNNILKFTASGTKTGLLYSKDKLDEVPVLTNNDYLIVKSESEVGPVIPVIPLTDSGMTIGVRFTKNDDGDYIISPLSGSVAKGSSADDAYGDILGLSGYKVMSVGGESLNDYILEGTGTLANCTEGRLYEVVLFKGTIEKKDMLKADTKLLVAGESPVGKVESIDYTEDGFAVLNLGNIQPGYYYIEGLSTLFESGGVFYYAG